MAGKIVVAMPTLSRSADEAHWLMESITALARHGFPIVAADGGSHPELLEFFKTIPNLIVLHFQKDEPKSLVKQIQKALDRAADLRPDYILYTEPDKKCFFENHLGSLVEELWNHNPDGMLIPARSARSFLTFPETQFFLESRCNEVISHLLGKKMDYLYGPFFLKPSMVSWVSGLADDFGWGWRVYLAARALRSGKEMMEVEGDFECPVSQRVENDLKNRRYRLDQMRQNLLGLSTALQIQ
jgi:hypothetical protein